MEALVCIRFIGRWVVIAVCLATVSLVFGGKATVLADKGIRCSLQKLRDDQRYGGVAYTFFVPEGWKPQSTLKWSPNNTFVAACSASTSDMKYQVVRLEQTNMVYQTYSGGKTTGIRLSKATDYLRSAIGTLQQSQNWSNIRLIDEANSDLPLLQYQQSTIKMPPAGQPTAERKFRQNGFIKISFERNGVPETASLGTTVAGTLTTNNYRIGIGPTARNFDSELGTYIVGPTLYVVSPSESSPTKVKEAQVVASSIHMTPQFGLYLAKLALAMSRASLNATIEHGIEEREMMRQQTERSMANFRQRMADRDAFTHDYCNYLLDQQEFRDRDGSIVSVPSNYSHAYVDNQGYYYLTDYPNLPQNQGYTELPRTSASGRLHGK